MSSGGGGGVLRTNSIGLAIFSGHHEWRFSRRVDAVHLSVVAQQQLKTLHVVGEGCGMQRGPATGDK